MPADCLFCKIFAGEVPSKEVIREDDVLAFEDLRPVAPTHVIVIPKEHIPTARDLGAKNAPLLSKMFEVANRIAAQRKIEREGYRLTINTGPNAGQSVYHLHLHVLGGRAMGWPPG
jgi:histidine triad (HIT) family protein